MAINSGRSSHAAKQLLARRAVELVKSGDIVGLGSGSTAKAFVQEICSAVERGLVKPEALVATSVDTEIAVYECGLGHLLRPIWLVDEIDIAVDGADEVSVNDRSLLKGGGGALTREKIVDYRARRFVVLVDESKLVDAIGSRSPIPIEVLPPAWRIVASEITRRWGGETMLRVGTGKLGPVITDNGNFIIDWKYRIANNTKDVEERVKLIPGVVESGIFAVRKPDEVLVSDGSRVWEL